MSGTAAGPGTGHAMGGTAKVNGTALHYEERGSGAPILCIHGAGSSSRLWASAVSELARLGRAIAYDRRGYGSSERPRELGGLSVAQHTDDAAALLEALGAGPAVIVGRSYGGQVAIDLALRHPQRVRAMALLEGVPESFDPEAESWLRELVERTLAAEDREPGTVARTLLGEVVDDWDGLPEEVRDVFVHNEPAILAEFKGDYLLDVTPEALASIRVPTLIVTASDSHPAFARANRRAAEAMPTARTALVDGSHMIDPACPPVLAFLAEVLG